MFVTILAFVLPRFKRPIVCYNTCICTSNFDQMNLKSIRLNKNWSSIAALKELVPDVYNPLCLHFNQSPFLDSVVWLCKTPVECRYKSILNSYSYLYFFLVGDNSAPLPYDMELWDTVTNVVTQISHPPGYEDFR